MHESSFVDAGAQIGEGSQVWHFCHIMPGAVLGRRCKLGQSVFVGQGVRIGNNVKIQNNVSVYTGVELEDDVFCGPSMTFTNIVNPRCEFPQNQAGDYLKTVVKKGASLGANVTVVCGHTIGRYAFVGAGAVVTKDVPDFALLYGNPARRQGWMCKCGFRIEMDSDRGICGHCAREYLLEAPESLVLQREPAEQMS
ncbi:MAG: N-acetyltransferase [Candidatus Omnitrophica bacterium]|nr:N-acetyltransferase [Candidatus Omnitrophota bacterium]